MNFDKFQFYPTPVSLLDKITDGINWFKIGYVLEPSAGKGNIADYVKERISRDIYGRKIDIDCIEIDPNLRVILKGKGYRVVHDDFLTYSTFKKYDLIIMNPPFSEGAKHLLKALDMQRDGGSILCILNAETLKNPFSNERKDLIKQLNNLSADITYMQDEFVIADRPTSVEIAVVKVFIPAKEYESRIFSDLRKKFYPDGDPENITDLAPNDFVDTIVRMYNMEVEAGLGLIREYEAMSPHLLDSIRDTKFSKPIIEMRIDGEIALSTNRFVQLVREKYWDALFGNEKFSGNMPSKFLKQYRDKVHELSEYDFSLYNIRCIQEEMSRHLIRGIEDCIIELFDKLSYQYEYSSELSGNVHYYNGWKTNKAWIINKKVILPFMNAFDSYSGKFSPGYKARSSLVDIEKALNYLDGGLTDGVNLNNALNLAEKTGQTKKIRLKYFDVTFYKKGTCHIEFTNLELLKKLNIFGSQQKAWLPPGYGKKRYSEMTPEETRVIDGFEGKNSYEETMRKADYYIYDPLKTVPLLGG